MDKREYYKKLTGTLKSGVSQLRKLQKEYDELSAEAKSGKYDQRYVAKELNPKLYEIYGKIRSMEDKVKRDLSKVTEEYSKILHDEDALKPEEINDDLKILQSGLPLTERDVQDIINRNNTNRTMTQLAFRYAKEHKLHVGLWYIPAEEGVKKLKEGEEVANIVFGWWNKPDGYKKMYESCLSKSSSFGRMCGVSGETEEEDSEE